MNISSIVLNSYFSESSHEPSMFPTPIEQFYQYNPIPILTYPEYSTNNYNISDNYIPCQEQTVNTIKIHINPFFRSHLSNRTNELTSEFEQKQTNSSRSRTRSPPTDRQVIISSNKKRQERQYRKAQREKFLQEKELIFKNQSSLFSKSKHRHSSPNRWEYKDEKLKRLSKDYSNEDTFKHWKPLLLKDCYELYQYAFDKYYGTS